MTSFKIEKIARIIWYLVALTVTLYLGWVMLKGKEELPYNILIFIITALLGYACVSVLVDRLPVVSNILGMSANIGEIYTHLFYGNVGLACSSLYYFITHVVGLTLWTKKENQDNEGKIKISKLNNEALIGTIIFCIVSIVLMYFYGDLFFKKDTSTYIFILNCIAFIIGVSAQFTMIMRQPFSWVLWSISNLIWLVLNLISHNYIFAIQSVLYEINAILGIYKWHANSSKK